MLLWDILQYLVVKSVLFCSMFDIWQLQLKSNLAYFHSHLKFSRRQTVSKVRPKHGWPGSMLLAVTSCCPCMLRWPPDHTVRSLSNFIFICSIKGWSSWAEIHPWTVAMFSSGLDDQAEEHWWSEDGLWTRKWHEFQSSRWIPSREDSVDLGRFEQSRTGVLKKWLLLSG